MPSLADRERESYTHGDSKAGVVSELCCIVSSPQMVQMTTIRTRILSCSARSHDAACHSPGLWVSEVMRLFHPHLIVCARYIRPDFHVVAVSPHSLLVVLSRCACTEERGCLCCGWSVVGVAHDQGWYTCVDLVSIQAQGVAVCISSSVWAPGVMWIKAVSCAVAVPRRSFVLARTAVARFTGCGSTGNWQGVGAWLVYMYVCVCDT